jgi:phage shock protein C
VLFGVAGGLAEYLNVDSTVVRVGFVLFTFVTGLGLLLYLILAILVPSPTATSPQPGAVIKENVANIGQEAAEAGKRIEDALRGAAGEKSAAPSTAQARDTNIQYTIALVLIAVGVFILLVNVGMMWWFSWSRFWPLVIIAIGLVLLATRLRKAS